MRDLGQRSGRIRLYVCGVLLLCEAAAVSAAPPTRRPENAALLYYQAALIWSDAYANQLLFLTDPNAQERKLLEGPRARKAIELIEGGTQISNCDWGLLLCTDHFEGTPVYRALARLFPLLDKSIRMLVLDGQYRAALSRCLVCRRFAAHLGNETAMMDMYGRSMQIDKHALDNVRTVLESMPPDADTLTWFRQELAATDPTRVGPVRMAERILEDELEFWLALPEGRPFNKEEWLRAQLAECEDEGERNKLLTTTDEEALVRALCDTRASPSHFAIAMPPYVLARARRSCEEYLDAARKITSGRMTSAEKCRALYELENKLRQQADNYEPIAILWNVARTVKVYYGMMAQNAAHLNATRVAIEIYLIQAETGHFPQTLPDGLPVDPFSSEDFGYRVTEEGFVLSCRDKSVTPRRPPEFDFRAYGHPRKPPTFTLPEPLSDDDRDMLEMVGIRFPEQENDQDD